jgi:hypothetical protein
MRKVAFSPKVMPGSTKNNFNGLRFRYLTKMAEKKKITDPHSVNREFLGQTRSFQDK